MPTFSESLAGLELPRTISSGVVHDASWPRLARAARLVDVVRDALVVRPGDRLARGDGHVGGIELDVAHADLGAAAGAAAAGAAALVGRLLGLGGPAAATTTGVVVVIVAAAGDHEAQGHAGKEQHEQPLHGTEH